MNSKALFNDLVNALTIDESVDERQSIAHIVLENTLGLSRMDVFTEKEIEVTKASDSVVKNIIARINDHEPLQYIFGETEFYGRKFKVNSSVLIPRPETEELVALVKDHFQATGSVEPVIIDIGTGSGCIAISLVLEIPGAKVSATDVSVEALETARNNAAALEANVNFLNTNILLDPIPLDGLDAVVSNPPYIPLSEKAAMKSNVTRFEPSLALFVADEDPIIFYRAIAGKAFKSLRAGGLLAVEINERFGSGVAKVLVSLGFINVQVLKDLFGKERIVKGLRP